MVKLYEHQELGKSFLLKEKKACLFFEVGTGKTYTALSALLELPKTYKVLIVAPLKVLQHVWKTQTEYDLSDRDVTYINYEKLSRDKSITKMRYDCIILDEVHRIKGRSTNCSSKIRTLSRWAKYVWGLTGTPVANNYADVYNIYRNMDIVEFWESYYQFCNEYYYVKPLEKGIYSIPILIAPRTFKVGELIARIGKHSLVKKAEECVDLPEKVIYKHLISWSDTSKYKEIERGIFKIKDQEKTMLKLEAINKAHQAANGYVYDEYGIAVPLIEPSKKLEFVKDKVEQYLEETDKIIVVYYYKKDKEDLMASLNEFYPTTDIDEFKNEAKILLLQFGQAEGLNLQFCNKMIFYTYDYSFLKFDQMCGRIYRNGQRNKVTYDVFISKNTIEEKIWKAIENKESTDEFLKGVLSNGEFNKI